MFIIKVAMSSHPIERVLMRIPELGSDYLIIIEGTPEGDILTIQAELAPAFCTDNFPELENLRRKIIADVRDEILVSPVVQLLSPGEIPRREGKAVRVNDLRKA